MSTHNCSPTALHYSSFAIVGSRVCYSVVAKRCVLEKKLLLTAYRKSYMRN